MFCKLLFSFEGSVIPFAFKIALPCSLLAMSLKHFEITEALFHGPEALKIQPNAYAAFSGLLGFLIVFRTSQAYSGYIMGSSHMHSCLMMWLDSAGSLMSFAAMNKEDPVAVTQFQHLIARLHSLLSGLALTELQDPGDLEGLRTRLCQMEVLELMSLNNETLAALRHAENKVELVYHWIQMAVMEQSMGGVLSKTPPPLLVRSASSLVGGMIHFQICAKTVTLPFPFPYTQVTLYLLLCHWVITPFILATMTHSIYMAGLFTFLVVFIFWALFDIAAELQNPFGDDVNDLDVLTAQKTMNRRLCTVIAASSDLQVPLIDESVNLDDMTRRAMDERMNLQAICEAVPPDPEPAGCCGCAWSSPPTPDAEVPRGS